MDNKVRVTGKKIDELQAVIAHLKENGPEYPAPVRQLHLTGASSHDSRSVASGPCGEPLREPRRGRPMKWGSGRRPGGWPGRVRRRTTRRIEHGILERARHLRAVSGRRAEPLAVRRGASSSRPEPHAIGRHGAADPTDGVAVGWAGGDHVLDLTFDLAKNIINDALHLAIRIDTDKIPGDLLRAYTRIETDARAQLNPSGFPTKAQRQEAKEAARIRAEAEAADGRFRRLKHYPVLWDGQANVLYAGTTSDSVLDRLQAPLPRDVRPHARADHRRQPGLLAGRDARARSGRSRTSGRSSSSATARRYSTVAWADSDAVEPRLLGQRVPDLALAHLADRRRHPRPCPTARRRPSCWPRP